MSIWKKKKKRDKNKWRKKKYIHIYIQDIINVERSKGKNIYEMSSNPCFYFIDIYGYILLLLLL